MFYTSLTRDDCEVNVSYSVIFISFRVKVKHQSESHRLFTSLDESTNL